MGLGDEIRAQTSKRGGRASRLQEVYNELNEQDRADLLEALDGPTPAVHIVNALNARGFNVSKTHISRYRGGEYEPIR